MKLEIRDELIGAVEVVFFLYCLAVRENIPAAILLVGIAFHYSKKF